MLTFSFNIFGTVQIDTYLQYTRKYRTNPYFLILYFYRMILFMVPSLTLIFINPVLIGRKLLFERIIAVWKEKSLGGKKRVLKLYQNTVCLILPHFPRQVLVLLYFPYSCVNVIVYRVILCYKLQNIYFEHCK